MNSFSKSRLRTIILLLILIVTLSYVSQSVISAKLAENKEKIVAYVSHNLGYPLKLEDISFSIIRGLRLKGVTIYSDKRQRAPIYIQEAHVTFKTLPLFIGKIGLGKIYIDKALFLMKKEEEGVNLQIIFSNIYKRLSQAKSLSSKILIDDIDIRLKSARIILADSPELKKNTEIYLEDGLIQQKKNKMKFISNIRLKYFLPEKLFITRFFKDRLLEQNIKCMVQGNIRGQNMILDMIQLGIGKEQLLGIGVTTDFYEKNPFLDIIFIPSSISLSDIRFIKNNFGSSGNISMNLKIIGPMDNPGLSVNALMQSCNFNYHISNGEMFIIEDLYGELDYSGKILKLNNTDFKLNSTHLQVDMEIDASNPQPKVNFSLALPAQFLNRHDTAFKKFEVDFKGILNKTLKGALNIKIAYIRKGMNVDMEGVFKDFDFDYYDPKEKVIKAGVFQLAKYSSEKTQKLNLKDLNSRISIGKDRLEIKGIEFAGYGGKFNGSLNIDTQGKARVVAKLKGENLDVESLMPEINVTDKLLTGNMDTSIIFDNRAEELLSGNCLVKNGSADLEALASAVKLPPLKNKDFQTMQADFAITPELIRMHNLILESPEIVIEASWDADTKLIGLVNIRASSSLLNQSIPFRKLLSLTRNKNPFIDFKFSLGGTPKVVRYMWLKNEFKEKLKQGLPNWVKKSIENSLDKSIDELSAQK